MNKKEHSRVDGSTDLALPDEGQALKKDSRAKWWLLTISAEKMKRTDVEEALGDFSVLGQLERGENDGFLHWQLVVRANSQIRFSTLKNRVPTAHIDPVRSIEAAVKYVQKKETRVDGVERLQWGDDLHTMGRGKRTDLENIREAILEHGATFQEVVLEHPSAARHEKAVRVWIQARDRKEFGEKERDVHVRVIFGESGVGKSRYLADTYGYESMYRVNDYRNPFDGYDGQPVLVLEEFAGQIPSAEMLQILDRYPLELRARYSNKLACFTEVVIVSNRAPRKWYVVNDYPKGEAGKGEILAEHVPALARRLHRVERMNVGGTLNDVTDQELDKLRATAEARVLA